MRYSSFEFIKSNLWHADGGNDGIYVHAPKSWLLFTPRSPNKNHRWDAINNKPASQGTTTTLAKRQHTNGTNTSSQPAATSNWNSCTQLSDETKEALKKHRMLTCAAPRIPLFAHFFTSFNNKPLCPGFCYINKYCYAERGKCTKAQTKCINDICDATYRLALIFWVEAQQSVYFVPSKGPTLPGL